jgi:NADP-dependent 3-hydroxy acid dehydrogenase YdfG
VSATAEAGGLAGQVAVITGSSRGIGRALARAGRAAGMRLVLSARGGEALSALAGELDGEGREVLALPGDVSDREYCRRLVGAAEERFGGIDVLINNAGLAVGGKIADTRPEDVETMVRVNFLGSYYCTRFALPGMIRRGRGHVVMMDSVAGIKYSPGGSIYSATKFALRSLAEALRNEVQEHNIKVTAIYPGITATSYFDPDNPAALPPPIPLDRMLTSEDVARATLSVLGLPDRVSINTLVIRPTIQER